MDLTEFFSSLDSVFTEKRFRVQKAPEVVSFAKFTDSTCQFTAGYVFTGSRHMHRPIIFMGVYSCNNRVLIHLACQTKFKVPASLVPSAHSFFNSLNHPSKGFWATYSDTVRFCGSHILPNTNFKPLIWLLIQRTDAWFRESMGKFVEWMKGDAAFVRSVRVYQEEFAYFTRVLPKDTVQEVNYKDMTDLAQRQLKTLGFSKYSLIEKYGKTDIVFTLTNEGTSTGPNWKMFPVIITVGPALLEIKIVFMMNEQSIQFSDPNQVEVLCKVLAFVNEKMSVGFFTYDSERKHVYLHAKCLYCLLEKKDFGLHMEQTLAICISSYKIYAYGFVELFGKTPIEEIFIKCSERDNYFRRRDELRKQRAEKEPTESSDPATDEYSGTSEDDSEKEEEVDANQRPLNQPISNFDESLLERFKAEIPAKFLSAFCLNSKDLDALKLVYWKYDDRLPYDSCIRSIIEGFLRLKRLGLFFKPLPFDSSTLNFKGELVLLPTFPLESMSVQPSDKDFNAEEDRFRFEIHAEMAPFLAKTVSKEKYMTLANFKVFRPMQDIDYIAAEKFAKSNLTSADDLIGNGGFGEIYKNEMDGVDVALKTIKPERESKRPSREYLKTEFRLMQACSHPNIVRVFGYTKFQEKLFLVMEYCPNGGLSRYLHSHNLPLSDRLRILLDVANGMTLVHAKSICHFDLKPQNVLLTSDLTPKICDFGLSQVWSPSHPCKKVGFTMMYASPEQVAKSEPGMPADVWAFGILIYYTLFSKHPFEYIRQKFARTDEDRKKLYDEISGRRRKPLFSKEFESQQPTIVHLIRSCLSFSPSHRPLFRDIVWTLKCLCDSCP